MKKWLVLLLGAVLSLQAATVFPINNFEVDGKPMLIPSPQKYRQAKGVFQLPKQVTIALPAGEELIVEQLNDALKRFEGFGASSSQETEAQIRFILTDKGVMENLQGYVMTVDETGIEAKSRTTSGLFWAAQTLRNLFRNMTEPAVHFCRIEDWPDFERRGYFMTVKNVRNGFDGLYRAIDAYAAMKLNWLCIDFSDSFPFKNDEFIHKKNKNITREMLYELKEFCRKRHIEISPSLQVLSHSEWMLSHPKWEEMKEGTPNKKWNNQPCIQNEEARRLVKMALEDHIEVFEPEIFFVLLDEIYLGPFQSCPKCKGKDPNLLLKDYMKFVEGVCKAHNVRPMMCQDSFQNSYGGGHWQYGDALRKELSSEDIILFWDYNDHVREEYLAPFKDFTVVGHAVYGKPMNVYNSARMVKKYGARDCTIVYWYFGCGLHFLKHPMAPDAFGGFPNSVDYLWNLQEKPYYEYPYDGCYEMARWMFPEETKLPPKGKAQPIPLEESINAELSQSGEFPHLDEARVAELKRVLASQNEQFRLVTEPGGKYYGLRLSGVRDLPDPRYGIAIGTIKGRTLKQLSFLMTTSKPDNDSDYMSARIYGKNQFKQAPVCYFKINYLDGTTVKTDLKFRYDINQWNRFYSGIGTRQCVRGEDVDGAMYNLCIYDFVNPHPEKPINAITFGTYTVDGISPVLLALSAWGMDKPIASHGFRFESVKQKFPYLRNVSPTRISNDFENGMGDVYPFAYNGENDKMKLEIVDDPTSPSKNKVLKMTVLPMKPAKGVEGRKAGNAIRFDLRMPYTVKPTDKGMTVCCRINGGKKGYDRCQDYIVNEDDSQHRMFRLHLSNQWQRFENNFYQYANKDDSPMTKVEDTRLRKISFFFSSLDEPVEIFFDNIGNFDRIHPTAPVWTKDCDGEPL